MAVIHHRTSRKKLTMYRSNLSAREIQLTLSQRAIFPGDPEPLWLTRAVQLEQAMTAIKADARSEQQAESERRSLVKRIRLVFGRA